MVSKGGCSEEWGRALVGAPGVPVAHLVPDEAASEEKRRLGGGGASTGRAFALVQALGEGA